MKAFKRSFVVLAVLVLLVAGAQPTLALDGWTSGNAGAAADPMAIQTFTHSEYDGGNVRLEFDWRDNTGDVLRFRCVNNSAYPLHGEVNEVDQVTGARTLLWQGDCPAHQTVTLPVNRFNLRWETGDLDGDGVPDGGLVMGKYQISTRWPAN